MVTQRITVTDQHGAVLQIDADHDTGEVRLWAFPHDRGEFVELDENDRIRLRNFLDAVS